MATCVFTCMSWFSMSWITCRSMTSGSSALSTRSFKFARISVVTRSKSAIFVLLPGRSLHSIVGFGRLVPDQPHLREQLVERHAREGLEKCGNLRRHLCDVAGNLMHAGRIAVARGDDGDAI